MNSERASEQLCTSRSSFFKDVKKNVGPGHRESRGMKGLGVNRHQQRQVGGTMVLNGPWTIRYSNRRVRGCCEVRRVEVRVKG